MSTLTSNAQELFEQYEKEIKDSLESPEGGKILKRLHKQFFEELKKLDIFLKFMIELFGEKLDDPTSKESELFNKTKDKYIALEKAIRYCEYYIKRYAYET